MPTAAETLQKYKRIRLSYQARVLNHSRNVLVQRELRRNLNRALRQAEREHIGQGISPLGSNDGDLMSLRRELLLSGL